MENIKIGVAAPYNMAEITMSHTDCHAIAISMSTVPAT